MFTIALASETFVLLDKVVGGVHRLELIGAFLAVIPVYLGHHLELREGLVELSHDIRVNTSAIVIQLIGVTATNRAHVCMWVESFELEEDKEIVRLKSQ